MVGDDEDGTVEYGHADPGATEEVESSFPVRALPDRQSREEHNYEKGRDELRSKPRLGLQEDWQVTDCDANNAEDDMLVE